jgi:endonuclease G
MSKTPWMIALAVLSTPVLAAQTACPQFYAGGAAPDITRPAMAKKTKEFCYSAFDVMNSGVTLTPLWSAEYLTPQRIAAAAQLDRKGNFHIEDRLPEGERAELDDYEKSGYDRGHLSPNHDMPDRDAQQESFVLTNMVPQAPKVNRGLWAEIEKTVRQQVQAGASLYVITGPLFEGTSLTQLNKRLMVPTALFKAVYDPKTQRAGAYVVTNDRNASEIKAQIISISALEQRLKINLFPTMPDNVKSARWALPDPTGPTAALNTKATAATPSTHGRRAH